jgi:hypothetical protein
MSLPVRFFRERFGVGDHDLAHPCVPGVSVLNLLRESGEVGIGG